MSQSRKIPANFLLVFTLGFFPTPRPPQEVEVKGIRFPTTIEKAGKKLNLVGAGLRERWFFDVYAMAAYSESGDCRPKVIVLGDEAKSLHIHLLRDVTAERMADALGRALADNTPTDASPELRDRIRTFLTLFREDLSRGDYMELTYIPAVGVTLLLNGQPRGLPTPGRGFAEILWSCYFGSKTCCSGLRRKILLGCSAREGVRPGE